MTVESVSVIPVESVAAMPAMLDAEWSEQDSVLQKANIVVSATSSLRFMFMPMNRATSFSRASNYFSTSTTDTTNRIGNDVETSNAERTTRIYRRQAKRVFRHKRIALITS